MWESYWVNGLRSDNLRPRAVLCDFSIKRQELREEFATAGKLPQFEVLKGRHASLSVPAFQACIGSQSADPDRWPGRATCAPLALPDFANPTKPARIIFNRARLNAGVWNPCFIRDDPWLIRGPRARADPPSLLPHPLLPEALPVLLLLRRGRIAE